MRQPLRVGATLVGAALLALAALPKGADLWFVATVGGAIVLVAAVLPLMTDFEIDALGMKAKGTVQNRETRLREVCGRYAQSIGSLAALVGVVEHQVDMLVREAVEETCRTWRGPIIDHLVHDHLVCQTAHVLKKSIDLGGPYTFHVISDQNSRDANTIPLTTLPLVERLALALVVYAEVAHGPAADMIDVEVAELDSLVTHARDALRQPGGTR